MALTLVHVEWLLAEKRRGVPFDRMLTLGRQHWLVPPAAFEAICRRLGLEAPSGRADLRFQGWADGFFREYLGVRDLIAIDNSDFEGAAWVHDLNEPIAPGPEAAFDVMLDTGTLEHLFNFPSALRNCLSLVKVGGMFLWAMPANNQCGHGFYQFSPELIFRALGASNGYAIQRAVLAEHNFPSPEYSTRIWLREVRDPEVVGARVAFVSARPSGMLVTARRIRRSVIFGTWPQQSDYAARWAASKADALKPARWRQRALVVLGWLPFGVRCHPIGWYQRCFQLNLRRSPHFRSLDRF